MSYLQDFHFIRPFWFLALMPLAVFIFFNLRQALARGQWQAVCDTELLPFVLQQQAGKTNHRVLLTATLASLLTITALAGPAWQRLPSPVFRNSAALVIALDLSLSMDATDIKPSRLIRARYKIADLLKQRKDGQTALLVYANSAFTVTPLTDDIATINSQLKALQSGIMPMQGSRSDLAVEKAVALLQNAGLQTGQILLVTDDENLTEISLEKGYKLSILGVGTRAGAPIKLAAGGFLKNQQGDIVVPKLELRQLQAVAQSAGGLFQQITDNDTDIEQLSAYFERMAQADKGANKDLLLDNWQEEGVWLLVPILLLAAFNFRKGLLSVLLLCALPYAPKSEAVTWQDLWQTPDQQAQQKFTQGDFQGAATQFTDSAWQAAAQYKAKAKDAEMLPANSATGFYNQGNVLAQAGKLEPALKAYEEALKRDPNFADASYNQDIVKKALEKQQQKKQEEQQQQDNKDNKDEKSEKDDKSSQQQGDDEKQDKDSDNQQGDKADNQDQQSEQESESSEDASKADDKESEQQQAEKSDDTEKNDAEAAKQAQAASEQQTEDDEQQQANQQWLNRIADDPSGLLKRKFLYQYSRQPQQQNSKQQW